MIRYELVPIYKREWMKEQIDMFPLTLRYDIQMKLNPYPPTYTGKTSDFMSVDEFVQVDNNVYDFIDSGTGMIL